MLGYLSLGLILNLGSKLFWALGQDSDYLKFNNLLHIVHFFLNQQFITWSL